MKKSKNQLNLEKKIKRKVTKNNFIWKYKYIIILQILFIIEIKAQNLRELENINEIKIIIDKNINNNITNFINSEYQNYISKIIINEEVQSGIIIILPDLENNIVNITIKFSSQLTSCDSMFYGLSNIINIDLSKFDLSQVTNMKNFFSGCTSLSSINLNNNNAILSIDLSYMFNGCKSLTSLDLSNFKATSIKWMLYNCISLSSLNLNNFDTSLVNDMDYAFYNCHSLK